jgi:hypothetical protein
MLINKIKIINLSAFNIFNLKSALKSLSLKLKIYISFLNIDLYYLYFKVFLYNLKINYYYLIKNYKYKLLFS